MKKTVTRALLFALVLALLAAGQSACGGGSYDSPTAPNPQSGNVTPTPY
jgi:hypothetical protein